MAARSSATRSIIEEAEAVVGLARVVAAVFADRPRRGRTSTSAWPKALAFGLSVPEPPASTEPWILPLRRLAGSRSRDFVGDARPLVDPEAERRLRRRDAGRWYDRFASGGARTCRAQPPPQGLVDGSRRQLQPKGSQCDAEGGVGSERNPGKRASSPMSVG